MNAKTTSWYIIINPHAGSGKTMYEWNVAKPCLDNLGIKYRTSFTDYKGHAVELAYDAAAKGYRRFLAVGGDGSVHEVFTGVLSWCEENGCDPAEFILGVAPIGSGNDWIKSTGVPNDVIATLKLIAEESFGYQDVVKVTNSEGKSCYMANIGGIGLDSHICLTVNAKKEAGHRSKFIYIYGFLSCLFGLRLNKFQVIADGKEVFSGPCFSIALGNGIYSGGGMRQTPRAVIDDGLLDVAIGKQTNAISFAIHAPKLFGNNFDKIKPVQYFKCKTLEIIPLDFLSKDIIEVDGEIEGNAPIRIAVTGQKIGVIRVAE